MSRHTRISVFAPVRVNLIGEHTDYNDGLALPFAIGRGVTVEAESADERRIDVQAIDLGDGDSFDLHDITPAEGWRALVRGVTAELCEAGHHVSGMRVRITSTLPRGQGLSSSAALSVAVCMAVLAAAGDEIADRIAVARLCARAEDHWLGARTGLLDQLAVLFGVRGAATRIDFRDLSLTTVRLRLDGWRIVVLHSGAERALATSGYNARRDECARALRLLGRDSMRDVNSDELSTLPAPLDRRARHVIEENQRVDAMVSCLERQDLGAAGALLDASHRSLRDLYEVSTPAVEATVDRLRAAGAAGARLMGGGFGGTVVALFPPAAEPPADALIVSPEGGARMLPA